uniref:Heme-binding protein 1 n=1 Tax=Oryzias latipes TaxID=8090 RepID=A0A3B3H9M8_ORYLA
MIKLLCCCESVMCKSVICVFSSRAFTYLLVIWVLAISAQGSVGPSTSTSFCTESKECLEYELICKTDEYEVSVNRHTHMHTHNVAFYMCAFVSRFDTTAPPAGFQLTPRPISWEWVQPWLSGDSSSTSPGQMKEVRDWSEHLSAASCLHHIWTFWTGVQMEMTAPVLVKIPEDSKMWGPAIYTLNFLLPAAYQENPPAPTNDKLYFTEMPHMDVYVRTYGGWMLSIDSRSHTYLLTAELERVRATYNHSYHYGVGYDSPLKLLNRHNEVWYVAEGQPVCADPQEPSPAHTTRPTPTHLPSASPSDLLLRMLSDSPSMSSSNVSSNATFNTSSLLPSDTSPLLPSEAPSSRPSDQTLDSSQPTPSAQMPLNPATNSSDPVSESPLSELQPDAELWNSTAHNPMDSEDEQNTVSEPVDAV